MFKLFSSRKLSGGAESSISWPLAQIVKAAKAQFDSVDQVGEDGPLKIYGISDNGVNFILALVQSGPKSGEVIELGFMARFVGFPVTVQKVENINRNLHIAVATMEGADLYLMAGLQVAGPYDDTQFALVMESWRRDLAMTIHSVTDDSASLVEAFPAGANEAARQFAVNQAPQSRASGDVDLLKRFLGGDAVRYESCEWCDGRGKRGLIARRCADCDGAGLVPVSRR